MKKSPLILIVLMLSSFFVMSSYSVAIPAQPNLAKDFALSTDYATHEDSITSFSETSEDDTLLYPDGLLTDAFLATGGDTGFGNTYVVDASYFVTVADSELEFDDVFEGLGMIAGDQAVGYFEYSVYAHLQVGGDTCEIYYSDDGVSWSGAFEDIDSTGWHNATQVFDEEYTTTWYLKFETDMDIDYIHLQFFLDPIPNQNVYTETFVDVSDWTATEGAITTDNDVGTISALGDDAYDISYSDTLSFPSGALNYYIEFRHKESTTNGAVCLFQLTESNGGGGANRKTISWSESTEWTTEKFIINVAGSIESIKWYVKASSAIDAEIDYIRIGASDLMGWQHDGSTLEGLIPKNEFSFLTTDGDTLNFSAVGGTGYWELMLDTTTTLSYFDPSYYPFMKYKINAVHDDNSDGNVWTLRHYYDGGNYYAPVETDIAGTFYENLLAGTGGSNDRYKFRIWCNEDEWFTMDYMKMYSIANYTITQGASTAITDYLFVDSGALNVVCPTVSNHYFTVDHDPTLDIDTSSYTLFNLSVSVNTQWFAEYVSGWQSWRVDTLSGTLTSGTMTDVKLLLNGSTIIFYVSFIEQLPEWNEIIEMEIQLYIPFGQETIDTLLVFLGLAMIPFSTCFLVYGGKKNMNWDKMFFFIILFMVGWGLVLGGIL